MRKHKQKIKLKKERDGLNFNRKRKRFQVSKLSYAAILTLEILITALLAFGLIQAYGIRMAMAGESMEPTINSGDEVMIDRLIYHIRDPRAYDVVVYLPKGNLNAQTSIKRVIGVPGDTVLIKGGNVYVNGEMFEERVIGESIEDSGIAGNEMKLGSDEYFLLGDNRNNSEDSRYVTVGAIKRDEISGKVWWIASLSHFGLVN